MTKPFTSVATMMLVEDGRIRLTDPIGMYLPTLATFQVVGRRAGRRGQADVHDGAGGAARDRLRPAAAHLGPRLRNVHAERAREGALREGGAGGASFWVDPKEQLVAVLLTQAQPGPWQREFRELFRQLVYQSIVD
jgi:CubicO group peptidase (beta-lactamase class C family)